MDYNVHRPGEAFTFVSWSVWGNREGRSHLRRPRASRPWSYCGLLLPTKATSPRDKYTSTELLTPSKFCRNCARAFYHETFTIYSGGDREIPGSWIKIWKFAVGELELVNAKPPADRVTIQATRFLLRNSLRIAETRVDLGTAELAPAEAFEAFVQIRDSLQVVIERLELAEETLHGFDCSTNRAASRLARQLRTILK